MTTNDIDAAGALRRCEFPGGCSRPSRDDPKTGRPSKYCGQADPGGPVHNKGNAWKERRRLAAVGAGQAQPSDAGDEGGAGAPVSMARATLGVQLEELPNRLAELRGFLETMTETIASVTDVESVASEVDQAHAEALAKVAEAERLRGEEERRRLGAETRARAHQQAREEADAAAEDAYAELARTQTETAAAVEDAANREREARAELDRIRADAEERIAAAEAEAQLAQTRAETQTATAQAAAAESSENVDRLRGELADLRTEARTDRDQVRADHAAQLAEVRQSAADRVDALTTALRAAEQTIEELRRQPGGRGAGT